MSANLVISLPHGGQLEARVTPGGASLRLALEGGAVVESVMTRADVRRVRAALDFILTQAEEADR